MDLGAFSQIPNLSKIMTENGISIPRLRGIRLMKDEPPFTEESIQKMSKRIGLINCEFACRDNFSYRHWGSEYSERTNRLVKKYITYDEDLNRSGIHWERIHGKKRKLFKYLIKKADQRVRKNVSIFNKYCGRDDVLYIHARIGGFNWIRYGGPELEKQPWFLDKVDEPFDDTYCDIYAKITPSAE